MNAQDKIWISVLGVMCSGILIGFLIGRVPNIVTLSLAFLLGQTVLPIARIAS